ncbi:MAG: radical SAM protein [Candidatus Woesearchaeota archaeon]
MKNMKILLLNPESSSREFRDPLLLRCGGVEKKAPYLLPPIGLVYLASLLSHNFYVEIVDRAIQKKSLEYIKNFDCIIVNVGLSSINEDLKFCRKLKTKKNVIGLCGGTPAYFSKEVMSKEKEIDFIILNVTPELVKISKENIKSKNFKGVENVCYRKNREVITNRIVPLRNINKLPSPRYELLPKGYYDILAKGKKIAAIITSLGCPFSCNFCSANTGRNYSERNLKILFSEIDTLCKNYEDIIFWDDNFTANKKRCEKICDYLKTKKINFRCLSRADGIDYELLKNMKEAGCYQIQFGIESGSERMLSLMNKRLNLFKAKKTLKACDMLGIETVAFFIIGYPGEDKSDIEKTVKFIKDTNPDFISINNYIKMPGSTDQPKKISEIKNVKKYNETIINKIYHEYYFNLSYVAARTEKLIRHLDYASLFLKQNIKFWLLKEGKLWKAIRKYKKIKRGYISK